MLSLTKKHKIIKPITSNFKSYTYNTEDFQKLNYQDDVASMLKLEQHH
jgi:hypothetical protein